MSAKFQPVILTATTPNGNHIQYEFFKGVPGKEEIVEQETADPKTSEPQRRQPASSTAFASQEIQNCIWKFFNKTTPNAEKNNNVGSETKKNENDDDDHDNEKNSKTSALPEMTKQYELLRLTFKYLPAAWGQQTEVSIELPHPASPSMFTKSIKYSKSVFQGMRQSKVHETIEGGDDRKEVSASIARILNFFEFDGNNNNNSASKESPVPLHDGDDDVDEKNIFVAKKFFETILFPAFASHSDIFLYHVNNSEIFVSLLSGKLQTEIEARQDAASANVRPIPIAEEQEECLK